MISKIPSRMPAADVCRCKRVAVWDLSEQFWRQCSCSMTPGKTHGAVWNDRPFPPLCHRKEFPATAGAFPRSLSETQAKGPTPESPHHFPLLLSVHQPQKYSNRNTVWDLRVHTQYHNVFPQVPGSHHFDNADFLRSPSDLLFQLWNKTNEPNY